MKKQTYLVLSCKTSLETRRIVITKKIECALVFDFNIKLVNSDKTISVQEHMRKRTT